MAHCGLLQRDLAQSCRGQKLESLTFPLDPRNNFLKLEKDRLNYLRD